MKNLLFIAALLLTACGTTNVSTTGTPFPTTGTPASNVNTQPAYQGGGIGPVVVPNMNRGIGPVNVAESNFYFAGDFQILGGQPLFYDCMAGANIPIATDKGIYQQLLTAYNNKVTTQGEILRAKIHGYFVNEPTADYPKKLVVTYVNDLAAGNICARQKELPGTWVADLIGTEKGTVTLKLTNTFDFSAVIAAATGTQNIAGSWMMTTPDEIALFYTTITPLMGNSIAFNPENMTLFVPTQKGTLIFKKQ